ncbi:MAG TPA: hypothetical protein VL966_04520 [Alphaproteobacteria bacterium]|nr:hypothetical protein [Alphaproteobacteria bacterium]
MARTTARATARAAKRVVPVSACASIRIIFRFAVLGSDRLTPNQRGETNKTTTQTDISLVAAVFDLPARLGSRDDSIEKVPLSELTPA